MPEAARAAATAAAAAAALALLLWSALGGGGVPSAGAASPAAGVALGSAPVRRVFVVGCGHSGTSLLHRSVGNLPGVRCVPAESRLFHVDAGGGDAARAAALAEWDAAARAGGFAAWVEKTPRHVHHMDEILGADAARSANNTRFLFIHRDGRDVALSLRARGYSWEKSVGRWVEDNEAALPWLDAGAALPVAFAELTSAAGVLGALRRVAAFLDIEASEERLAAALFPGTRPLGAREGCTAYGSDAEKAADLARSVVGVLAGRVGVAGADEAPEQRGIEAHNEFRTWQMQQVWAEIPAADDARRAWTREQAAYFWGRDDVRRLMARFGYGDDEGA